MGVGGLGPRRFEDGAEKDFKKVEKRRRCEEADVVLKLALGPMEPRFADFLFVDSGW